MSVDDHRRTCISDFTSVLLWHPRSTLLDEGRAAAILYEVFAPGLWVAQFAPVRTRGGCHLIPGVSLCG
jgi:hypothetical protein